LPGVWPHSSCMMTAATMMINSIAFYDTPFYLAILSRHTQHNTAKPKSDH
jgi:hypothetical protein